jgi:DNA polymerase-3 subunit chi
VTEVQFYHLLATKLDRALPKLIEKALQAGFRVQVKTQSEEEAETLSAALWTYQPGSFLPHGTREDGRPAQQPVYLASDSANVNGADMLMVTDGSSLPEGVDYKRLLDLFDGQDEAMVASARQRWKQYQAAGHAVSYVKQTPDGGWTRQ